MKKIVIIGGGITGLSTLYYLNKYKNEQKLNVDLMLIERNEYLGGKIHSVHKEDFIIETGADSIVARNESVMPLIKELGLEDEMVYNSTGISFIFSNNELHPIPAETVFGIPTSKESLFSSTLISEEGKQEALKDFELKNEHFTSESSIGSFLEYYLGKEIVEKQIAPVLSGVYSGKLSELSIASTLPYLLEYKNKYGSIIKGFYENKQKFLGSAANKKFISFQNGLSSIISRMEERLSNNLIVKGLDTVSVRKNKEHYEVELSNGEKLVADHVILTTPHQVAMQLLNSEVLNESFNKLSNSSLISIYLGFQLPDELLPADGTGFIAQDKENVKCDACTWTSRKWKHTSQKQNLLVRLFYKSSNPNYSKMKVMSEAELIKVALQDIENSLGIKGEPEVVQVTNWNELMPNYHLEHKQAVESLSLKMSEICPHVILAGCSYYGVGIGACIQNGKETAELLMDSL